MSIEFIISTVKQMVKKYATNDPYSLCRAMKIFLLHAPMGTAPDACKGFYLLQSRQQAIMLNSDLCEEMQNMVAAHEIGHVVLHRKASGISSFHDFTIFDKASVYEFEANIFAAELLLDDRSVLNLLYEELSFFGAASQLNVPPELLDFKCRILKYKGYKVIEPPLAANSSFLKKI